MYPYQIYKVMADQHIRDLRADTREHGLTVKAADHTERWSRLRDAVAHLLALVRVPQRDAAVGARARSTSASTGVSAPAAGPMGCAA